MLDKSRSSGVAAEGDERSRSSKLAARYHSRAAVTPRVDAQHVDQPLVNVGEQEIARRGVEGRLQSNWARVPLRPCYFDGLQTGPGLARPDFQLRVEVTSSDGELPILLVSVCEVVSLSLCTLNKYEIIKQNWWRLYFHTYS